MDAAVVERTIAFIAAIIFGITAVIQLRRDWAAHGLDAAVTKVLLGLLVVGFILSLLAAAHVIGVPPTA
jgi:hypothetical protein